MVHKSFDLTGYMRICQGNEPTASEGLICWCLDASTNGARKGARLGFGSTANAVVAKNKSFEIRKNYPLNQLRPSSSIRSIGTVP